MTVLDTLLNVLEASSADRVVLRPGERPHAMTLNERRDIGTATLSAAAMSAIVGNVLSADARQALQGGMNVSEEVRHLSTGDVVIARAYQENNVPCLELLRQRRPPAAPESCLVRDYVEQARAAGATALYLRVGSTPVARINGRVRSFGDLRIDAPSLVSWQAFVRQSWTAFDDAGDRWVRRDGTGTVHCRMFVDAQGPCTTVTFASVTDRSRSAATLPRLIQDVCEAEDGVLIVSAPTHAQVAAIASAAASFSGIQRGGYVVVIEPSDGAIDDVPAPFVSRRVVADAANMAAAIEAATTELPDVMVVVTPSSSDAVAAALLAATGDRLVIIATLARNAVEAVEQVVWSPDTGHVASSSLARAFQGAVSVRRIRRLGGGFVDACDVLKRTPEVVQAIEHRDRELLQAAHRAGVTRGRHGDADLARAVVQRRLSLRAAVGHASDPSYLVALVRGARRRRFKARATNHVEVPETSRWMDLSERV